MSGTCLFWAARNDHIKIATGLGVIGVALGLYACVTDLKFSATIFDLKICQNHKGGLFGALGNIDYISHNLQVCSKDVNEGKHDLFCTGTTGGCLIFDGSSNGNDVFKSYTNLLTAANVFTLIPVIGNFIYTVSCIVSMTMSRFAAPPVSPIQELEILRAIESHSAIASEREREKVVDINRLGKKNGKQESKAYR